MESSMNNSTIIDFDEYCTKLDGLINNIETNLKNCNKKYKDKNEIEDLYHTLTGFLNKENLNDSKLYDDLTFIEKDLRRSHNYNETNRKKFGEYKEKIKHLNTELKSMKTMLDKSNSSWFKFNESYDTIERWLDEQENLNDVSSADLSNYQKYQRLHSQFNDSANFLLQVSDPSSCSQIKEQLLYINKMWKSYQDKFKDTNYEHHLKFYECDHSLNMIKERLTKIETLTNRNCKCNLHSISKYQEEIQKAFNDLECLDANLKLILKLTQRIDMKQNKDKMVTFIDDIKNTEAKLNQLRNYMPDYLKKLTKIYTLINSIDDGLPNIEYWITEGESLLKTDPDQLNFDQISKHIEKQKKHFNDLNYHENSIANKTQSFQTLKQLITQNFDTNDLNRKLNRVKDLLSRVNSKRLKWEELFQTQQTIWRGFHSKTKQLEEWIMQAQKIVSEKNDDYNFLIHKHKDFFDNINNEILHGFLDAGQKLVRIKSENDKNQIKLLMDTLEGQWKMILSHAPVRLLKLQFKRLELLLKQEIKDADDEISEEFNALNENKDVNEILKRHEAKFKHSDFFPICESYLQGLKTCTLELADKKAEDKTFIEDAFDHLQTYWNNLTQKIEALNVKLTTTSPDTVESFERNLSQMDGWLYDIEMCSKDLFDYNLQSSSEYRRTLDKMKNLLNEFKLKQKQLTKTLTQFELLSKQNSINDSLTSYLSNVQKKFENLVDNFEKIQNRCNYLDVILKISAKIDTISNKIRNLSSLSTRRFMAEEDDSSLQMAVEEQKTVLDQMRLFEKEIDQLKLEANNLSTNDYLQMPTVVYEKLNCVQESIRHSISEELERRSSLLEIRQVHDQKQVKIDYLNQNLEIIECILSNKNPNIPLTPKKLRKTSFIKSSNNSLNNYFNEKLFDDDEDEVENCEADVKPTNLKQKEYSKYLKRLSKCKEIIGNSRRTISELKIPNINLSASAHRTPTPCNFENQQIKEFELRLDSYERDIDIQIDIFEHNLARQVKIDKSLDELNTKLVDIIKRFEIYNSLDQHVDKTDDIKKSINLLEMEQEKGKKDLELLQTLKVELNQLIKEKRELLEDDNRNLSRSRIGSLLEGFNETIFELDLRKDNDLNLKLNELIIDLNLVEENCKIKLSEIKYKLNQQSISKKQKKLNLLKDTLDLQLDTLIGLKVFQDTVKEENEEDFEDLRKESANILLERCSLDESNVINSSLINQFNQNTQNPGYKPNEIILTIEKEKITEQTKIEPHPRRSKEGSPCRNKSPSKDNKCQPISDNEDESFDIKVVHETTSKKVLTTTCEGTPHKEHKKVSFINDLNVQSEEKIEDITPGLILGDQTVANLEVSEVIREETFREEIFREEIFREETFREETFIEEQHIHELDLIEHERIRLESEMLKRELEEKKKLEREMAERNERERIQKEKLELEKQQKLELEKQQKIELERQQRLELERQQRLEIERQQRLELEKQQRLEMEKERQQRLEQEKQQRLEMERERERQLQLERERYEREQLEMERLIKIEREKLEREKLDLEKQRAEKEALEREKFELEREKAYREKMERERLEHERQRQELERIEREKQEIERQRQEIERIERERQEMERQRIELERVEQERIEMERQRLEIERIERERLEMERQRAEMIERERQEFERQRMERERIEIERLEYERKQRLDMERIERERIEMEMAEMERVERERAELERLEWERIQKIEREREERLRNEIIEIERIRNERQEKERLEFERIEQERQEAERLMAIKKKQKEEAEALIELERQKQMELEAVEDEKRRKKLEELEEERMRNQEKLKLELDLKEICETLNILKEKILSIQNEDFNNEQKVSDLIQSYQDELNDLDDQVLNLYNESVNLENKKVNPSNSDYYLFDSLDQATLTQFELIRSFLSHLNSQIDTKRKELLRRSDLKNKIAENEQNLEKYIELAVKFNSNQYTEDPNVSFTSNSSNNISIYVTSMEDLENRIESIESIECSIQNCFKQITELNKGLNNILVTEKFNLRKLEIELNTIQPLLMNLARFKQYLSQWKHFEDRFNELKQFLSVDLNVNELVEIKNKEALSNDYFYEYDTNFSIEDEFEKYTSLRERLVRKLADSDEIFMLGTNLFHQSHGQQPCVIAPNSSKNFNETRDFINEISKFLDEKCAVLNFVCKEHKKLVTLDLTLNRLQLEIDQIEFNQDENSIESNGDKVTCYKLRLDKLSEVKKKLRIIIDDRERNDLVITLNEYNIENGSSLMNDSNQQNSCVTTKFEDITKNFNVNLRNKLDDSIRLTIERLSALESDYHQAIMQNLPSRSALNELNEWIKTTYENLDRLENDLENDKPIDLSKIEIFKKKINLINDEMHNEREIEYKFILDAIEKEIKQGFYDLTISEKSAQLENDWNRLKQKLNSILERAEITLLKLNEFIRSIAQVKTWISNKNKQNEIENITKFKTNLDESTIIMDNLNSPPIEDEKNLIKQILTTNQELDDIKSFWENDKIVNEPTIKVLIHQYIHEELNNLKTQLDNIELINKVKIENNLTQLKQNYTNKINELNMGLQNEINFITHGKLTSYQQFGLAVKNIKIILEQLDETRNEMKQNLNKYELDLKSTDIKMVLNIAKTKLDKFDPSGFLLDPHLKHSILNNLTNRDLETSAKTMIYLAEKDLLDTWRKYDETFKSLVVRLDQANESIANDLANLDSTINSENLIIKSNLFEQTLNDMIKNKALFEDLESISGYLLEKLSMNENLKVETNSNKMLLQDKFKDLSTLADKLSQKLENAGREHKNFLSVVDNTENMILQTNKIIIDFASKDLSNQFSNDLKAFANEIEANESSLREQMGKFKNLNIKDSERIGKICELTSTCTNLLAKQRDIRMQILDQIQERNYLFEIKLNDIESFLNSYANYLSSQFGLGSENDPNLLDRYINSIKYMLSNEFELNKCEKQLDQLEIEINDDKQREKLTSFRNRIAKFRKQVKIVTLKDGFYDKLLKLKHLKHVVNEIDLKKTTELKLINFKDEFIGLKFSLEKLSQNMDMDNLGLISPEIFRINCLIPIETQLNNIINEFISLNDLNVKYQSQSSKLDSCLNEVQTKLANSNTRSIESLHDLNGLESKLNHLKDLKVYLTSDNFKIELEELENIGKKLESKNDFQVKRIKYLDLLCDIDKSIKKIDYDLSYLKKIVDKSQNLLDLIKDTHKILASVKLSSSGCAKTDAELNKDSTLEFTNETTNKLEFKNDKNLNQILDFLRYNILEKLNENESIKNEILELYSKYLAKSNDKCVQIKDIIDKLLFEWNLVNEKCIHKIKKFELFKTKLNDLDFKLSKIREYCGSLEIYLENEMFKHFDLTNLKQILTKKTELENLYECIKKKDSNTEYILKTCVNANKTYLSSNKQNLFLIVSLKNRWFNLKLLIKDKLFKLSNLWLFLCDINDQIENFYLVLEKTENFYKNTLVTANNSTLDNYESRNIYLFKLIEELYVTINQDYKLIKYLNESFVNFSKFVYNFDSNDCLTKLKQKLLDINSRWDGLHNEIAIKIRVARRNQNYVKKTIDLPYNEKLNIWLNEISLLITNLEHVSTKELQLKSNDVEDLKKEICEQTEILFKNDGKVKIESSSIDRVKDVMKRILRLDSYIQQSSYVSRTYSNSSTIPSVYTPMYFDFSQS